uniref:SFRICE_025306 n=1 Tax=Spodoptera frugiperda TaxID=7108 RepID=A0A2H1WSZ2_SPOFR
MPKIYEFGKQQTLLFKRNFKGGYREILPFYLLHITSSACKQPLLTKCLFSHGEESKADS